MKKRILSIFTAAALVLSLAACSTPETTESSTTESSSADNSTESSATEESEGEESADVVEVTIPTYKAGENVGAILYLPQIERFNEMYEGQYKIIIEEVPQDTYAEKLKQLGQQEQLPVFFEGTDALWVDQVAIPNGLVEDISGWFNESAMKDLAEPDSIAYNTTEDGAIYSVPNVIVKPVGVYYNETMYPEGATMSQGSFDDFMASLGDNDVALMTADNAWTTMLMATAIFAVEEGGADILKNNVKDKLYDYSDPAFVNTFTKVQTLLQNHATSNTLGAAYADAANAFMSGNAAVIANGSWMTGDFAEGSEDKWSNDFTGSQVRATMYPGNVGIANTTGYTYFVAANATDEEKALAYAFFDFLYSPEEIETAILAEGGSASKLEYTEEFLTELEKNVLLSDFSQAVNEETILVPGLLDIMPPSFGTDELSNLLPGLISGDMTAEEFCAELTEAAQETLA